MTPQIMDSLLPAAYVCAAGAAGVFIFGIGRKNKGDKAALPESGSGSAIDELVYPVAEELGAPAYVAAAAPEYEEEGDDEPAPLDEYGDPITLPGLPLLGVVPALSLEALAEGHGLLLHRQPDLSPAAEAYRRVWERLGVYEKSADGGDDERVNSVRVLAVAGPEPGEGVSTTTANLAMAAARLGYTVLVVDADLARPSQHLLLGAPWSPGAPGLGDLLMKAPGTPPPTELARPTVMQRVRLIPAGSFLPTGPEAATLFATPHATRFVLSQAPAMADIVLFDAPPAVGGGPGGDVVGQTSGVILVVDSDRRESPRVRLAVRALEKMGASMLGGVVVPASSGGDPEGTPGAVAAGAPALAEEATSSAPTFEDASSVDPLPAEAPAVKAVTADEQEEEDEELDDEPYPLPAVAEDEDGEEEDGEAAGDEYLETGDEEEEEAETVESTRIAMASLVSAPAPVALTLREEPVRPLFLAPSAPSAAPSRSSRRGGAGLDNIKSDDMVTIYDPSRRAAPAAAAAPATTAAATPIDEADPPVMDVASATEARLAAEPLTEEEVEFSPAAASYGNEPDPLLTAVQEAPAAMPSPLNASPTSARGKPADVMLEVLATPDAGTALRATTPLPLAAAPTAGMPLPRVLLEISTKPGEALSMRAGTPSSSLGGPSTAAPEPDAPDVLLETTTREGAPDAATMRLLVTEGAAASEVTVLDASLQKPEAMSIRSGVGSGEIGVRFEMSTEQNGGTRFRATVAAGQGGAAPALLLEMERSLVDLEPSAPEATPEKRWRNRVTLRTVERG